MNKESDNVIRVGYKLPGDLVARVDQFAKSMNINKTAAVCLLLTEALNTRDMQKQIPDLVEALKSIQEHNKG